MVYRKGIDLLGKLIPIICKLYPNAQFIIGGDGPKRAMLNEVVRQNKLADRVQLLGAVKADQVRNVLIQGDIFLNSSLTEAFCIAIVEAVSCGLQVVTTNVGGIPEVLPPDLIWLGEPTVNGLVGALRRAIWDREQGNIVCPLEAHNRIREYYQWPDIAERTELIYDSLIDVGDSDLRTKPNQNASSKVKSPKSANCFNDENNLNQLNTTNGLHCNRWSGHSHNQNGYLNGHLNGHPNGLNGLCKSKKFFNGLSDGQAANHMVRTNRVNNTAKKVLYENQPQLIDLDYLREYQDKTGPRQLLRQCYNSSWIFGTFLLLLLFIEHLMRLFCDFWSPRSQIDLCPSTANLNRSTDRPTKIRSTKEVNKFSVLKVNRHQFTKSCTNCELYVQQPALIAREGDHLASPSSDLASWIRQYSLGNQLNNHLSSNHHSSSLATTYMHPLDLTKSTNPVNLLAKCSTTEASNQCGLIRELMNHKTDTEQSSIVCADEELGSVADELANGLADGLAEDRSDCADDKPVRRTKSPRQTSDGRSQCAIDQCQHTISEFNYENATDDEAMSQESIESVEFSKQAAFDDDEKHSTTESTSGYNTSNSLDSDNSSDSHSTGSANDLAELSYDCHPLEGQERDYDPPELAGSRTTGQANHPSNQKRRRKSISSTIDKELNAELNAELNNQLNDQLTSLLALNGAQSEANNLFYKSNLNLNNNSPNFECFAYRCDDCLHVRRRSSILIKN